MTNSLNVVPSAENVETGVRNIEGIADGLKDVLADTHRLTLKTQAYHWNVTGPLFYSVHNLTETQYEDMFEAADVLAERVRALGQLAPFGLSEIVERSRIRDFAGTPSAEEMIADLADDHEAVAHRLHALAELAAERKDIVTEDLATERSSFHEQAVWMLRALIAS
ncbi:MAG: DNA starvation/stationary phase protection protein [Pseudomonadota bacterium]